MLKNMLVNSFRDTAFDPHVLYHPEVGPASLHCPTILEMVCYMVHAIGPACGGIVRIEDGIAEYAKSVGWWARTLVVREAVRLPVCPFRQVEGGRAPNYLVKDTRKIPIWSTE